MELDELSSRLGPFCQAQYADPGARVFDVHKMPGHAGFAYGFSVASGGDVESWFIRLPPPNVQWKGTADVLRQVAVLNALDGTTVSALPASNSRAHSTQPSRAAYSSGVKPP